MWFSWRCSVSWRFSSLSSFLFDLLFASHKWTEVLGGFVAKIFLSPHNTKRMVSGPSYLLYFSLKLSAWAPPFLTFPGLQKKALGGSCGGGPLPDVLCSASPTCCAPYLRYVLGVVLCEAKTKSDLHEVLSVTRWVPSRMPRQRRMACFFSGNSRRKGSSTILRMAWLKY